MLSAIRIMINSWGKYRQIYVFIYISPEDKRNQKIYNKYLYKNKKIYLASPGLLV